MKLALLLLDDVLDSALGLTLDVVSTANRLTVLRGARPAFELLRLGTGPGRVRTARGLLVPCDARLSRYGPRVDAVIVPGWDQTDPQALAAQLQQAAFRRAAAFLREAHAHGALVTASCSATFLLAEAGLLSGRVATTTWFLAAELRKRYPDVDLQPELTLARDRRVWTAGAALSVLDLLLALVVRASGPQVASLCVRYLALEAHPTQARYMSSAHFAHESPELSRAESHIRSRLARPPSLPELSRAVGTSPRTLARRSAAAAGTTPLGFARRIRVEQAVHLLETTRLPLDEVAHRVGYADPSSLRRLLKRQVGCGARALRTRRALRAP